jgi:hypothetical protein
MLLLQSSSSCAKHDGARKGDFCFFFAHRAATRRVRIIESVERTLARLRNGWMEYCWNMTLDTRTHTHTLALSLSRSLLSLSFSSPLSVSVPRSLYFDYGGGGGAPTSAALGTYPPPPGGGGASAGSGGIPAPGGGGGTSITAPPAAGGGGGGTTPNAPSCSGTSWNFVKTKLC